MIQPKNNVYSDIFFLSLGKLTIAVIVYKFNSEIGRILVIYYVGNGDKNEVFAFPEIKFQAHPEVSRR